MHASIWTLCAVLSAAWLAQEPGDRQGGDAPPKPEQPEDPASLAAKQRRRELAAQEEEFFRRCDQNGNGWISLREAREAMGLDDTSFGSYDVDRDGRVTRPEFSARYRLSIDRVGGFKPPTEEPRRERAPTRNSEQLRNAYDKNGDGGLSALEMKQLLLDYERAELPAELAVEKLDRDGSSRIDGGEIDFLARLLTTSISPAGMDPNAPKVRQTLEELFGGLRDRSSGYQTAPMPPQIDGPVTHFRRLDLDGSGGVSIEDLRRLQSPLELPVRAGAVLAALDVDGDGELSPDEFARSMQGR